jgi:hypothetical protein
MLNIKLFLPTGEFANISKYNDNISLKLKIYLDLSSIYIEQYLDKYNLTKLLL